MAYKLDYLAVLKAIFIPADSVFLLLAIGIPVVIIGIVFYQIKRIGNSLYLWMTVAPLVIIPVLALLFICQQNVDSGWRLKGNKLEIKAWPAEETINLTSAQVALVDSSGPWQPVLRVNGFGAPGLATGWFNLRNGKKAIVFYHLTPAKMLVVRSDERYYLLAYPKVEKLYRKLILRGVSETDL